MNNKKLQYVSGDFVAEYSTLMSNLSKAQKELDECYERSILKLLAMETARLEEVVPMPFEPGDEVITDEGRKGAVLACPVDINLMSDESYSGTRYGPGRYITIDDEFDWEDVITCEGMIRKVTVEIVANVFEKDWGHDKVVQEFWPDELRLAK